jgi:hypothetical protein
MTTEGIQPFSKLALEEDTVDQPQFQPITLSADSHSHGRHTFFRT